MDLFGQVAESTGKESKDLLPTRSLCLLAHADGLMSDKHSLF